MSPPSTINDTTGGKGPPPCGPDTAMAATPTPAQGGHTISLKVYEFVRHGGFYRVALAINSRSEIPVDNVVYDTNNNILPPTGMPSGTSDHADYENPPVFPVLADNLFPHDQAGVSMTFQADIMLPNVTCARCTLQVIEFMHPHGFNAGGGYFYHHCAELAITADPALPPFMPGTDGGGAIDGAIHPSDANASGSGGSAGGDGATGAGGTNVGTGAGGASGSGQQEPADASAASDNAADSNGGCSCSLRGGNGPAGAWCVLGLFALATLRRRAT